MQVAYTEQINSRPDTLGELLLKWRLLLMVLFASFAANSVNAQTPVGNGTVIAPAAGVVDTNAVPQIGGGNEEYATRHYDRGMSTGIGGSFIGTSSPTSESSPAVVVPYNVTKSVQFHLPKLDSDYPDTTTSPALHQTFSPALTAMPRSNVLTSPLDSKPFSSRSSIEGIPSFSRSSVMDSLKFDVFEGR